MIRHEITVEMAKLLKVPVKEVIRMTDEEGYKERSNVFWRSFLITEKCAVSAMGLIPMTISASLSSMGLTKIGMSAALY